MEHTSNAPGAVPLVIAPGTWGHKKFLLRNLHASLSDSDLLYVVGDASSHFSQTGNIVLGVGAVAGLAAAVHGGAILGRTTKTVGQTVAQLGTTISAANMTTLNNLTATMVTQSRHSLILMAIALVCMGSARYL